MLQEPVQILERFPIRKSKKQKQAFRDGVKTYLEQMGYSVHYESFSFGGNNVVIGNAQNAKYLITAHYDTPASIGIPNFLTPCNPVIFILYQVLVIGFYLLIAFGVGYLTSLITDNDRVIFLAAYIAYFAVLILMMAGPANRHNANDNTSGVVTVLNIAANLPVEMRDQVAFVLFDLEELGLVGSSAYSKRHKQQVQQQIVLNLDCVGDGEHFMMFPVKKAKKDEAILSSLRCICTQEGNRTVSLRDKGFAHGNSDHKNFPYGVGFMAFHKAKVIGLYCDRIHTWRDTILDPENVAFLSRAILELIANDEKAKIPAQAEE